MEDSKEAQGRSSVPQNWKERTLTSAKWEMKSIPQTSSKDDIFITTSLPALSPAHSGQDRKAHQQGSPAPTTFSHLPGCAAVVHFPACLQGRGDWALGIVKWEVMIHPLPAVPKPCHASLQACSFSLTSNAEDTVGGGGLGGSGAPEGRNAEHGECHPFPTHTHCMAR